MVMNKVASSDRMSSFEGPLCVHATQSEIVPFKMKDGIGVGPNHNSPFKETGS